MTTKSQLALECRQLGPEWANALEEFFDELVASGTDRHFHPHPFTADEAVRRCNYSGTDLYYVLVHGERVLGYGLLRGWDEGYSIPSLGIALRPTARGIGLGKAFMHFLHAAARYKGATGIRLKVFPGNESAVKLYTDLGYRFVAEEADQLVGMIDL